MSSHLTLLDTLNDASITEELQKNFDESNLFTTLGQCLISLNPYPVYSYKLEGLNRDHLLLSKCCGKDYDASVPESHIYKFAENIRRSSSDGTTSQAVIFRGCSGSGKSENYKAVLHYLLSVDSVKNDVRTVSDEHVFDPLGSARNPLNLPSDSSRTAKSIAAASHLCDLMGTSVTDRNRHSTRHFKLCKIFYGQDSGRIAGMKMKVFGTDLLRYNGKDPAHNCVFMLSVFAAGISKRAEEFKFNSTMKETYLHNAELNYGSISLSSEFNHLQHTVLSSGILSEEEWDDVLRVFACCVNLQCLALVGSESTIISSSTKSNVSNIEGMLGLEAGSIGGLLLKRQDDRIGKPAGSMVDNKPSESKALADALCGTLFTRAFDHLMHTCSVRSFSDLAHYERATNGASASHALHLLDMPGWERSDSSSSYLQTLLVNHSEERFHALYIDTVFVNEIERYALEGVQLGDIAYMNCSPYLELFDKPPSGLISLFEEASQAVRVDDKAFLDKIFANHVTKSDLKLVKAGGPKMKATVFVVKHTFADVNYDCEGFIMVNKTNALSAAALTLLTTSRIPFVTRDIDAPAITASSGATPPPPGPPQGGAPPPPLPPGGASNAKSKNESKAAVIANYFMTRNNNQLNTVINTLRTMHNTFYVLCISTANVQETSSLSPKGSVSSLSSRVFNKELVMNQVRHMQIESVVAITKKGFSYVKTYYDFYTRFRPLHPFDHKTLPYSIIDSYSNKDSTLTDTKLVELCRVLLQQTLAAFKLTVSSESEPVYGKSSLFLKEVLATQLEEVRYTFLEVSNVAIKKLQATYRMSVLFRQFRVMKRGVTLLQACTRCNLLRGVFLAQKFAASKVKAYFRMHRKFVWFRRLKKSVNVIKAKLLGSMIQRIRYKRLLKASRMFQNIARGFNIRKIASRTFDAVQILQRCAKAFLTRRHRNQRLLKATTTIQYIFRGYSMRKRNVSLVNVLKMRREQRIATRVVKKIQSIWRGKLVTIRFDEIVKATTTLQWWLKSRIQLKKYTQLKRLTLWLQCVTRKLIAISRANSLRVAHMVNEEKGILSELYTTELSSIQLLPLTERVIGSGLHTSKGGFVNRFERYLLSFDVNFDLNFAYPEGWCNSIIQFTKRLKSEKKSVVKIVIGAQHTVIVDDLFNVYTMGLGDLGQLGHNNRQSLSQPKIIEKLAQYLSATECVITTNSKANVPLSMTNRIVVKDLCCGRDHTLLLTGSGRVYAWGDNKRGQLGHSKFETSPFAKLVGDERLKRVASICCGAYHSACIVEPGLLYTWGAAECLGRVSTVANHAHNHNSTYNRLANTNTANNATKSVTTYNDTNTDCHTSTQPEYNNNNSPVQRDSCEPDVLPFFQKRRVLYACCGENHVTVKTAQAFYAWGMNNQGQLGINSTASSLSPAAVLFRPLSESQMGAARLHSGGRHMLLLVSGDMYLWGWNKYGQIGNNSSENVLKPTLVPLVSGGGGGDMSHSSHKTNNGKITKSPTTTLHKTTAASTTSATKNKTKPNSLTNSKHSSAQSSHAYVKSVSVGWRHVMAMSAGGQIYGWGMLNLANHNNTNNNSKMDANNNNSVSQEMKRSESDIQLLNANNTSNSDSKLLATSTAVLSTSECFFTPTSLNTALDVECYTRTSSSTLQQGSVQGGASMSHLIQLSGCSSSSLSVVCVDVELYSPLTGSTTSENDRTRRIDKTIVKKTTPHKLRVPLTRESLTQNHNNTNNTMSSTFNNQLLNNTQQHLLTSTTNPSNNYVNNASRPGFNQTYKPTPLSHNPEFHIDHLEFKERLKRELGSGISMGAVTGRSVSPPHARGSGGAMGSYLYNTTGATTTAAIITNSNNNAASRSRNNSMSDLNFNNTTNSAHNKSSRSILKDSSSTSPRNTLTSTGSPLRGGVHSRAREGELSSDDLVSLFSPIHIRSIRNAKHDQSHGEDRLNIDTSNYDTQNKNSSSNTPSKPASFGVGMPRTEKAFLATFAANNAINKGTVKSPSKSPRFSSSLQSNTSHNASTSLLSPTLSYSSRLAARRASMDTSSLNVSTASPSPMNKRLSFRSATGGDASRRSSLNDSATLSNTHSNARNSARVEDSALLVRRDGSAAGTGRHSANMQIDTKMSGSNNGGPESATPSNDYLGLDSAIEKLRGDLQRMNTPLGHVNSSGGGGGGGSVSSDGTNSKKERKFSSVGRSRTVSSGSGVEGGVGGGSESVTAVQTSTSAGSNSNSKLWEAVNKE